MNDEDRQRIVRINAWFKAQPIANPLDDSDLYYARALAQSCAESYVTRQRVSKVETSRNAPKKGRA